MIPPHSSLVKYDNPILVSTVKEPKKGGADKFKETKVSLTPTEDILNSILPPRFAFAHQLDNLRFVSHYCISPSPQGMDRRRAAVGAVRVKHTSHCIGCHLAAGTSDLGPLVYCVCHPVQLSHRAH